jgi:hypothetical protein
MKSRITTGKTKIHVIMRFIHVSSMWTGGVQYLVSGKYVLVESVLTIQRNAPAHLHNQTMEAAHPSPL